MVQHMILKQEKRIRYFIDYGTPKMTFLFYFSRSYWTAVLLPKMKGHCGYEKDIKTRLCGAVALSAVITALPTTPVHAESKQYWTESAESVSVSLKSNE